MNLLILTIYLLFILDVVSKVSGFVDPFSFGIVTLGAGVITYLLKNTEVQKETVKLASKITEKVCQMMGYCEGCEDYWIPANLNGLEYDLKSEVFGQPLAVEITLSALKSHLKSHAPSKPLVLSFQGPPGVGKNFISKKILKNMFVKGHDTKYVKFYRGSSDFPLKAKVEEYKKELVQSISDRTYQCYRSVFVFDEVDKMPDGILDVVSSFVRRARQGDHNFRRVIFILLSNVGSQAMTREALIAWKLGVKREDMSSKDLYKILATESYNSKGGLKHTGLVKNEDVSYYVPFFPLERYHVIQCLEHYVVNVKRQVMSPELTELVLEELLFYPDQEKIFSNTGCKRIPEVADYLIERETHRKRKAQRNL